MNNDEDRILREILAELQGQNGLLRLIAANGIAGNQTLQEILQVVQSIDGYVSQIVNDLNPPPITGFTAIQEKTMVPLAPGQTATFATTPIPSTSVPVAASLIWSSSDTVNAPTSPNTADTTGLSTLVAFPTTAVVGTSFTLTISYTNSDGTLATQSNSFTIVAPPSPDVTGFTAITQTA